MNDDEKQALLIDHGLREAELLRKLEQQTDWYQQRFNALRQWVNTEIRPLSEEAAYRYFAIVANGSPAPHEQADWRETMHGLTLRAERAEKSLRTVEMELANTRNIASLETQRANRMSDLLAVQEQRLDSLVAVLARLFDWEDKTYAHAVMHVENAVNNLRSDLATANSERLVAEATAIRLLSTVGSFAEDEAEDECHYEDECPPGARHGTCTSCKARRALLEAKIHVWAYHEGHESCRHCGVVRREDDINKPCKGKVALSLR